MLTVPFAFSTCRNHVFYLASEVHSRCVFWDLAVAASGEQYAVSDSLCLTEFTGLQVAEVTLCFVTA